MAKKRRSKKRSQRKSDHFTKSKRLLRRNYKFDTGIDDRRVFRPNIDKEPLTFDGRRVTYTLQTNKPPTVRRDPTLSKIQFANPKKTFVCKRRRERRITLFAINKVGKGKKVSRIRRRTPDSNIKC